MAKAVTGSTSELLSFGKHVYKHRAIFQRLDLVPLTANQIYRLRVLGHDQLTPFFANNTTTRMTNCQVRVTVLVLWYTFAFVGVVDIQRCPILDYAVSWRKGINDHNV
jgi:hypothetical protein